MSERKNTDSARPADQVLVDLLERRLRDHSLRESLAIVPEPNQPHLVDHLSDLERRLESLIEATQKAQEPLSLDLMLTRLVALLSEAFGADRSSLFLYDADSDELFSRVAQGALVKEIRFSSQLGIAGAVFHSGEPAIVDNAYRDSRFNREIDTQTGYVTSSILCVPVRTRRGDIIGVAEVLNKHEGHFTVTDVVFLRAFTTHMASALENAHLSERARDSSREESQMMEVTRAISSELDIDKLLRKIMSIATDLLEAERSTLFVHDPQRDELWSRVAEGLNQKEIRIPSHVGIAGEVFTTGKSVNIPDAYNDPRFNPEIDRRTGFRTRSILGVPVINKHGAPIGVVQVLNRQGGIFSSKDRRRLEVLAAQSAIALENAQLFRDVVLERNYTENVLRRLTDGVITVDRALNIVRINDVAARLFGADPERVLGASAQRLFRNGNSWIRRAIRKVMRTGLPDVAVDVNLRHGDKTSTAINLNISPLFDPHEHLQGCVLVFEDITNEKRVRSAMARYMTREVAEQVLAQRDTVLGGRTQMATVLFADIANFTSITEQLGATDTVTMLNNYFTAMVEVIFTHGGILDKYIGDGIMAVFGAPFESPRDADRAAKAALDMQIALAEFNGQRASHGHPPLAIRIGINSDHVIAGNIGSHRRMDYTVIGDGVNLAARLESANRYYGTNLLLSRSTLDLLQDSYQVRELDWVRVKGKSAPVPIYELLSNGDSTLSRTQEALLRHYSHALTAYRERDWRNALTALDQALSAVPSDQPSQLLRTRVLAFIQTPPPATWDAVWNLLDK